MTRTVFDPDVLGLSTGLANGSFPVIPKLVAAGVTPSASGYATGQLGVTTDPADPGLWLKNSSGSMVRASPRVHLDVRDFGAKMNGVDDDAPALRSAHAYAATLEASRYDGGGACIRIPRGVMRLASSDATKTDRVVDITACDNVRIIGEGQGVTTLKVTGNWACFKGDDTVATPLFRWVLEHLTIYGPGNSNANAHGVRLGANNNCRVAHVQVYACRRAISFANCWHTDFLFNMINGGGGLACYHGYYAEDGDASVVENGFRIVGGRVSGTASWGFRGESISGADVLDLEVLGCGATGVYLGESPSGKDLKWFNWFGGLIDTCPDLLVVKAGTSTVAELVSISLAWMGYANEPTPGTGIGAEFVGLKRSSFSADQLTNVGHAANIQNCERFSFNVGSLSQYDRLLTGGAAIICNGTTKSTFRVGSCQRTTGSTAATSFVEQNSANYNLVDGVYDKAVTLIGANSKFNGIQNVT